VPESAPDVPSRTCDVIFAGEGPSALRYNPGLFDLARTHRFRVIASGTAGSLTAVLTAAAEYGRESGGFEKLAAQEEWRTNGAPPPAFAYWSASPALLAFRVALERRGARPRPGPGLAGWVARFWSLFPEPVRWLLDVIPGAMRDALPARYWIGTVAGCVVGGALDVVLANGLVDASHPLARTVVAILMPVMFIGGWSASVGACAAQLWSLASHVKYGPPTTGAPGDAFARRLQDLAGLPADGPFLTVGRLREKRLANGEDAGIEMRSAGSDATLPPELTLAELAYSVASEPVWLRPVDRAEALARVGLQRGRWAVATVRERTPQA
jgi:hypothetical protein